MDWINIIEGAMTYDFTESERIKAEQKAKDKPFKTMSTTEKWALPETIAKMLGLID